MMQSNDTRTFPVVPLRDTVVFPGVSVPIAAGRPRTVAALRSALKESDRRVFVVAQRENVDEVTPAELYSIGTVARIGQLQESEGVLHLLLLGEQRGIAVRYREGEEYLEAAIRDAEDLLPPDSDDPAFLGLQRELKEKATEVARKAGMPEAVVRIIMGVVDQPGRLADLMAAHLEIETSDRQRLLETLAVEDRMRRVLLELQRQLSILEAQEDIQSKVQQELGDRQREMLLREQLKAIQNELGDSDAADDLEELKKRLDALELSHEVRKEVEREWGRLQRMARESMEAQVIRTFLETVAELPWGERSEDHLDVASAAQILAEDHYALEEVKDRVLEFLAVRQLKAAIEEAEEPEEEPGAPEDDQAGEEVPLTARPRKGSKAPILLFVGPPGVGKTSMAKSIARAMGREYVRISLGGARDEADIRGHRRTYVGALPGRIIQGLRQAGTMNPVFLLDEVDKVGASFHGDPSAALLEVLDPAQNHSFTDHYLGLPFDLSEVMFIATANYLHNIPEPLLDRMEVVPFSGYTEQEKLEIAKRYLIPRQLKENALSPERLAFRDEAVQEVITRYTREAGVRQLERELGKVARKVARKVAARELDHLELDAEKVEELLGRPRVHPAQAASEDQVGVVAGLYYTPVGGDIMYVEASTMPGKGKLVLTGHLGEVMKESAQAAWSFAKAHAAGLQIGADRFEQDVHVHVPAGAVPKDGPSAGITMATALVSALSGRPIRHDTAMTGELTLSGRVLPIGGVKEKVLGAVRAGIRRIVLPKENVPDLEDLPEEVRESLEVLPAEQLGEVLAVALRGAGLHGGRLLFSDSAADPDEVPPLVEKSPWGTHPEKRPS